MVTKSNRANENRRPCQGAKPDGIDAIRRPNDLGRLVVAALIPLTAFVLQWIFWNSFKPFAWIFFYPAVFFSAWIGGLRCGLASIAVSTLVIWWFFIPNRYSFLIEQPAYAFTMFVFASMGVLFSFTFERLRKANQQAAEALAAVRSANDQLEAQVLERTADLQQTNVALRESERESRTLAEAMPQLVWITRPDGWNIYFNQRWVDYTGLTLEESYGHGWNKPFHPDDRQRASDVWSQATAGGGDYELEVRLRRADGAYHWWLVRGVPLRDASGKILKWFGTCTDIENIKQAEVARRQKAEELLARNDELEQFNRAMVGRELRMIELKQEINELRRRLGEPPRHETDQFQTGRIPGTGPAPAPPGGGGA